MRGTLRLAVGSFALAALATFASRTSAQTSGGLPTNTSPILVPTPTIPGEAMPRPIIPTMPQVAETNSFLDGGSFALPPSTGFATSGTAGAFDAGSLAAFGGLSAFDGGAFSGTSGTGIGGSGTAGFGFDAGF